MRQIIDSFIKDFAEENNLSGINDSEVFEHFVNFCVVSRVHTEPLDVDEISVGGKYDTGIDGIAIIVNEHIVNSIEDVDYFKKLLRRLDVKLVFIQAKSSSSFNASDVGNFLFGVEEFFKKGSDLVANDQILHLKRIVDHIYNASVDMNKNPICEIFYATKGTWNNDKNFMARVNNSLVNLRNTKLFSEVTFTPLEASSLRSIYRELKHKIDTEIIFEKHTILPEIENVREAYIGILPSSELLKIILNDEGNIRPRLFYDNVRHFQGNNPVNNEIADTIKTKSHNDKFALLNNGLTIVAKSINQTGDRFQLMDYQIVNGCQTTHIIYQNRAELSDNIYLPIKVIVTDDVETTNMIIRGTNRQTNVHVEAFEALSPFQKELEEFYLTYGADRDSHLHYERRSKQYEDSEVSKSQIITMTAQLKSTISMFLNEPHSTHRYYGELHNANKSHIFIEHHSLFPYYTSAYAIYTLENLFNQRKVGKTFRALKYQMLLLFRLLSENKEMPPLTNKKEIDYYEHLIDILEDNQNASNIFDQATQILSNALATTTYSEREAARRRDFTEKIIDLASETPSMEHASDLREKGSVAWFSEIKGYGIINRLEKGETVFVHSSDIEEGFITSLRPGELVEFTVIENDKGRLQAIDVKILYNVEN